jgi:hypothetical protein
MNQITTPISVGELIDKLTILKIKLEKITDEKKLKYILNEYNLLGDKAKDLLAQESINSIFTELMIVNERLWVIEDLIRKKEKNNEFDKEFVELARSVYITNDMRFELKNKINELTNSQIKEQKSY